MPTSIVPAAAVGAEKPHGAPGPPSTKIPAQAPPIRLKYVWQVVRAASAHAAPFVPSGSFVTVHDLQSYAEHASNVWIAVAQGRPPSGSTTCTQPPVLVRDTVLSID